MDPGQPPSGLSCPKCGGGLRFRANGSVDAHRLICVRCRTAFRLRRRDSGEVLAVGSARPYATVGNVSLFCRGVALQLIEAGYHAGVVLIAGALLIFGGIGPVVRGWLRDEIARWPDILATLGGVHIVTDVHDPDADLGPVLARYDAPLIFSEVDDVSRRLGVRPPGQIRLTYLPCCGVVAWGKSRALILGLPLLRVLSVAELRAILAHELAHLARGDATSAARSARFVEGLRTALDRARGTEHGPLGLWARSCYLVSAALIAPIARSQERRADGSAASIAGGGTAATALVKVAMVQPLFREVLEHYDPTDPDAPNLYAFFRAFWYRLPAEVHTAMRLQILANSGAADDPTHPPLPDRLAHLQTYPDVGGNQGDGVPATSYVGDLELLEQMLHNRLFGLPAVEPSCFHRAVI